MLSHAAQHVPSVWTAVLHAGNTAVALTALQTSRPTTEPMMTVGPSGTYMAAEALILFRRTVLEGLML